VRNEGAIEVRTMMCDDDGLGVIPFDVVGNLQEKLTDQRLKLDQVDPKKPGKLRYQLARAEGCFAAVSKGAKDRELMRDEIFFPHSELSVTKDEQCVTGHSLRISCFKATVPVDSFTAGSFQSLTFSRKDGLWKGEIEVVGMTPTVEEAKAA